MSGNAHKICPKCRTLAPLDAQYCSNCGHKYRTQFMPPQGPPGPATPPAIDPHSATANAPPSVPSRAARRWLPGLAGCAAVALVLILWASLAAARDRREFDEVVRNWLPGERLFYESEDGWWLATEHKKQGETLVYSRMFAIRIGDTQMEMRLGDIQYEDAPHPLNPKEVWQRPERTRWGLPWLSDPLVRDGRTIRAHFPAPGQYEAPYDVTVTLLGSGDAILTYTPLQWRPSARSPGDGIPVALDAIQSHFIPVHLFDLTDVFAWHAAVREGRAPLGVTKEELLIHRH